ncbi:MAG TPA: MarR family transcriptional regulator [Myxococcota bacterium]|nr:MarR family transcriptional regulator [Myxococcota bacterium]
MPQAPSRDRIDSAIGALQRLSEVFLDRRRQLARESGLSEAEWRLLEEIAAERFMPSLFARRRERTAAAVSRVLRGLVDAGLIAASVGESDARQRVYRLTPKGRERMAKLRERRERAIAAIWRRFPAADLAEFERLAAGLAEALERYAGRRE